MKVQLQHENGFIREVKVGFSWTIFFFGGIPFLFRGMPIYAIGTFIASCFLFWIPGIIMAFMGNKMTAMHYLENGYKVKDDPDGKILKLVTEYKVSKAGVVCAVIFIVLSLVGFFLGKRPALPWQLFTSDVLDDTNRGKLVSDCMSGCRRTRTFESCTMYCDCIADSLSSRDIKEYAHTNQYTISSKAYHKHLDAAISICRNQHFGL